MQLQGEETKQEENGKPATSAASLPADFTVKGNLVDANAEIQGVPPARASNAEIELAPSSPDSETSFTEPTEQAKSYHDDSGANCQLVFTWLATVMLWKLPGQYWQLCGLCCEPVF